MLHSTCAGVSRWSNDLPKVLTVAGSCRMRDPNTLGAATSQGRIVIISKVSKFPSDHHVRLAIAERRSYKHAEPYERTLVGVGGFERLRRVENMVRRDTSNCSEHVERLRLSLPPGVRGKYGCPVVCNRERIWD